MLIRSACVRKCVQSRQFPLCLRRAIKTAIAETNAELGEWRERQLDAGYATLADVPTDRLDGESVRVFHYFNAVCAMTTATLYERFRGVDATARGDKSRQHRQHYR